TPAPTATLEAPKPTAQPTNTTAPTKEPVAPTQHLKPTAERPQPTAIPAIPKPTDQKVGTDLYVNLTEAQKIIATNAGIKDLPAGTELRWISDDQIMVISYNGPIAKYGDTPANSIYNQNNVKCPSISACMSNGKKYRIEYSISPGRDNPKNPYHIGLVWIFEL
ncbi:MAG: hypothetical protein AAB550_02265, partial [Patescibacteria group bacterium]